MAFELRPHESVLGGIRRLARKELKSARTEIRRTEPPCDHAIYEARKSVKKVRAIVQLIEDDDGTGLVRSRKRLRSVNRLLSGLRDTEAMLETLVGLRRDHPQFLSEQAFARVKRRLSARKRHASRAAEQHDAWKAVDQQLRAVRRLAKRWRPAHRGPSALAQGIRAVHRRGRKAMRRAQRDRREATLHAWRKEIKGLWYALRLAGQTDPRLQRDIGALHEAETWLGENHNLAVLRDELSHDKAVWQGAVDVDQLRVIADHEQCRLLEKAVDRVQQLYARRSGAYARSVARAWKKRRHQASTSRVRGRRRTSA